MAKVKGKYIAINLAIIGIAAALYVFTSSPASVMTFAYGSSYPIYRCASENEISLQCAVTWNASALDGILQTLDESNVDITFVVSGEWAEHNAEMLRRMQTEGHEIGTMGYYPDEDGRLSWVKQDVSKSLDVIEAATGTRPTIYYCGTRNSTISARAADSLGLRTVLCTIDIDCETADAEKLIQRIEGYAEGGSIVIAEPTAEMKNALPKILMFLQNKGLAVVPTGKMLYNGN